MKKYFNIIGLLLFGATAFAQIYIYDGNGLIGEFEQNPDSIITIAPYRTPQPASNTGALNGVFSVSKTRKVRFSKGNLQYRIADNVWQFAEHQYDTLGGNIANPIIDQFGFGTSGWEGSGAEAFRPTDTIAKYEAYIAKHGGMEDYSSTGYMEHRDWGIHNPIVNGGNQAGLWRTLTYNEWRYITTNRWTPYAVAIVNGVWGIVVLPDGWNEQPTLKFRPCYYDRNWKESTTLSEEQISEILESYNNDTLAAHYELGINLYSFTPGYDDDGVWANRPIEDYSITPEEWLSYEAKGCVFLPFNKSRNNPQNREYNDGTLYNYCTYWSSHDYYYRVYSGIVMEYRVYNSNVNRYAFTLNFSDSNMHVGGCVRLVQDY